MSLEGNKEMKKRWVEEREIESEKWIKKWEVATQYHATWHCFEMDKNPFCILNEISRWWVFLRTCLAILDKMGNSNVGYIYYEFYEKCVVAGISMGE
jgi:hypothetical protein